MELTPKYKRTEVGIIPEDWDVEPIAELSEFITSGSRGWAMYYSDEGPLFIRSQNIRDGRLDFTDQQSVLPPLGSEGSRTRVKRNDVLVTITGNSVGNVAWVDRDLGEAYISQHVGLIRLLDVSLAEFVCRFLATHSPGNTQIWASQSGQSKPGLNLKNLAEFLVALPPSPERRAIAVALKATDALLEGLERLIAKKRDLNQAAMQQLLTGKTRLPGFTRKWQATRLEDVAEIIMGQSPNSQNYNTGGVGLPLIQGNADVKRRKTIKRIFTAEITKRAKCGDILMSVRAPVGEVARVVFDVCLGRGACAIRYNNDFLYHYLISVESSWSKHSKGSTFDSVNSADVKSLVVYLPNDLSEQRAVAKVLNDMDEELAVLEQRLAKTGDLKQAMVQQLLTGRKRLVASEVAHA